jgi:hypothetical protein
VPVAAPQPKPKPKKWWEELGDAADEVGDWIARHPGGAYLRRCGVSAI